jgi:formate/nitrite transporter FocA (FNT family)
MNAFSSLYQSSVQAGHYIGFRTAMRVSVANAMKQLWCTANLAPIVTFATGIVAGLLIPSGDWPAITTAILAGVVLHEAVKAIDRKCERM